MAVLRRRRHHSTCGCPRGHAFGARIAAGGDFAERILVEPGTCQRLFHLRAHGPGIGPDESAPIARLDASDQAGDVFEVGLKQGVEVPAHGKPEDAARPGERGIHLVQLIELTLQHVELLQCIVQKIGLDPEILQHLLKLADFLGNVLGVHRGHTLCRGRSGDIEGKRESNATGEKGTGQAQVQRKSS